MPLVPAAPPSPRKIASGLALLGAVLVLAGCGGGNGPAADGAELGAMLRVADATHAAGDLRSAVPLYRRAHQLYPDSPAPLLALGRALSEIGAHGEALDAWQRANRLAPEDTEILRGLANALLALDQPQQAFVHYEAILAHDPLDVRAHNGKGIVYDMLGRHEAAQAAYRQGLALAPGNIPLRNNLGLSLALSGAYGESLATLGPLASEPGAGPKARQNLALVYGLAGNPERAAEIAGHDLPPEAVEKNLAYYALLRQLVGEAAARRLAPEAETATP